MTPLDPDAVILTVGDTRPELTGTVSASLVGASRVRMHARRPDRAVIVNDAEIVDAAAGTWRVAFEPGDLAVAGTHLVEVEVTFADGRTQTFKRHPDTGALTTFHVDAQYA